MHIFVHLFSYPMFISKCPLQRRNMSNFYAEGIDLKVSEKYRVPPRISVPRDVIVHVSGDYYSQLLTANPETEYDFNLERNVIRKIEEWKRVHDQNEHVRHEQLRAWDRERRQLIEQEQKHLLNQVSYPSTADLSSSGDEGENNAEERRRRLEDESSSTASYSKRGDTKATADNEDRSTGAHNLDEPSLKILPNRDFSTILKPTVVPESSAGTGMRSFQLPDSFTGTVSNKALNQDQVIQSPPCVAALNYSDWESDNYSPFDRMELKSINDLDILAQVLQTTQLSNKKLPNADDNDQPEDPTASPPSSPVESPSTTNRDEGTVVQSQSSTQLPVSGGEDSWNHQPAETSPSNVNEAAPTATSTTTATTFPTYIHQQPSVHPMVSMNGSISATPNGYYSNNTHPNQYQSNISPAYNVHNGASTTNYSHYSSANFHYPPMNTNHHQQPHVMARTDNGSHTSGAEEKGLSSLLRSRSKSVPDIVNELEEEVKASEQRRRVRNHSQCNRVADNEVEDVEEEDSAGADAFERLPRESKELAIRISRMGFPINVVATVVEQIGNDDKKVGVKFINILIPDPQ